MNSTSADTALDTLMPASVHALLRAAALVTGLEAACVGRSVLGGTALVCAHSNPLAPWAAIAQGTTLDLEVLSAGTVISTVVHHPDGSPWGHLIAADRRKQTPPPHAEQALAELAVALGPMVGSSRPDFTVQRIDGTWRMAGEGFDDLLSAMVLADLLAAEAGELSKAARPAHGQPIQDLDAAEQLRVTVSQLERALSARVLIEQAIGVLAERHKVSPRQAFEDLRRIARSGGRIVHDLALEVVRSATHEQALPSQLRRPGSQPATPGASGQTVPSPTAVARAIKPQ